MPERNVTDEQDHDVYYALNVRHMAAVTACISEDASCSCTGSHSSQNTLKYCGLVPHGRYV